MKTKTEILQILRMMKPKLAAEYNVKTIGIFGSVVRNEAHRESDIDVLVEFEPPIGLFKFLELEELLSERLGGKVDLVSKKALKPEIGRTVLAEAVLA
ncbi:MAG: nucleotidyltransferase family protein [Nitrospirae bacterium]|nr:nucleotidyltransferase family protein [Candidatus Manganitrophaceae bacterium]